MSASNWSGLYRGVVVGTAGFETPPHKITVVVPQVTSGLGIPALPCFPTASADRVLTAPSKGEGVWVMFENGDLNYPVYIGFFGGSGS